MADNVVFDGTSNSPTANTVVATDFVGTGGGGSAHFQRIKLDIGPDGTTIPMAWGGTGLPLGTLSGGTIQTHGTSQALGTYQPLAGSVHVANAISGTVQTHGTSQILGTVRALVDAGTVQTLGTYQAHGTTQVLGSVSVQGHVAHGAAATGAPVLLAAFGSSGTQAAVDDGDSVRLWADLNGRLQVRGTVDSLPPITGTIQAHGTLQALGTVQPLAGSVHVANALSGTFQSHGTGQTLGTVRALIDAGTVQALGTYQAHGTTQVLGTVRIVDPATVTGTVQTHGTSQVLGTVQVHGTSQVLGTVRALIDAGTIQVLGTIQTHGTTQALGTVQPLAGSVHPAAALPGTSQISGTVREAPRTGVPLRTKVPAGTEAVTFIGANVARAGVTVFNGGNAVLYLALGSNAGTIDYSVQLASGAYYETPYSYTGTLSGIWNVQAGVTGTAYVTEVL